MGPDRQTSAPSVVLNQSDLLDLVTDADRGKRDLETRWAVQNSARSEMDLCMASAGSDGTCMSWHTGVYSTLQVCTFQGFSAIEMESNHEEFYDPIQYEYPAGELDNEPFYNDRVPRQAQQSQRTTRDEAALTASISAFWLDFECLRDEDGEARSSSNSDDVYLICDVVRAVHSVIISVSPPVQDRLEEKKGHTALKTRRLGSASGVLVSGRFPSFCFVRGSSGSNYILLAVQVSQRAWLNESLRKGPGMIRR